MFQNIVIIGVGLIGGSLGLSIRRKHPDSRIIGVSSPAAIQSALDLGVITEGCGYGELQGAVKDADLVFLCTPIHRIQGLLTLLAPLLPEGVLVTDVGSTKRVITHHAAAVLPRGVHFIGGHPMAGAESRGVGAADPFLFQNAMYVLCPDDRTPGPMVHALSGLLGELGARVIIMEAKDTKGFLRTLFDILVVVEDKPGAISQIATELALNDINIKDIEVLKVREGEGGTLRLAFEREQEAIDAIALLGRVGYPARLRR